MSIRRTTPKLSPGVDVGVVGTLRKGVLAHQIRAVTTRIDRGSHLDPHWHEEATAACNGRLIRRYSYGWAAKHGARLCGNCFGGAA